MDRIPSFLKLTKTQREAAWAASPPRPMPKFRDARTNNNLTAVDLAAIEEIKAGHAQMAKEATTKRINKMKEEKVNEEARRALKKSGMKWDQRTCRWIPETIEPEKRTRTMRNKLLIIPLDGEGQEIKRGLTSVDASASREEIEKKIAAAAARAGRKTSSIRVTSPEHRELPTRGLWRLSPDGVPFEDTKHIGGSVKKAKTAKEPKGPGVIATIKAAMARAKGATHAEMLNILVETFPERNREGMLSTCKIQANKNATEKEKVEGRGLVYYIKE